MKIYYAPNTRAVRIVWLFEELGLPYDLERFTLGDAAMRAPEYLTVHPMGRVPALQDGEVTLFESGAIVQYVLAKYGTGVWFRTPPRPTSRPICNGCTMQKA
jgi:glutathione S-transferase